MKLTFFIELKKETVIAVSVSYYLPRLSGKATEYTKKIPLLPSGLCYYQATKAECYKC